MVSLRPLRLARRFPVVPVLAALTALAAPRGASAQEQGPPPPACDDEIHRAFDYWAGEWLVRNAEGAEVGRNRVTVVSGGCGLLEEWTAAGGTTGKSLNFHDPARDEWRQVWVGEGGQILDLAGGPVDGVMTLEGEGMSRQGPVQNRISWIPRDGGRVEQLWEFSRDDGETWSTAFQGFYEPANGTGG